jgi:hypothetical protein
MKEQLTVVDKKSKLTSALVSIARILGICAVVTAERPAEMAQDADDKIEDTVPETDKVTYWDWYEE